MRSIGVKCCCLLLYKIVTHKRILYTRGHVSICVTISHCKHSCALSPMLVRLSYWHWIEESSLKKTLCFLIYALRTDTTDSSYNPVFFFTFSWNLYAFFMNENTRECCVKQGTLRQFSARFHPLFDIFTKHIVRSLFLYFIRFVIIVVQYWLFHHSIYIKHHNTLLFVNVDICGVEWISEVGNVKKKKNEMKEKAGIVEVSALEKWMDKYMPNKQRKSAR